LDKCWNENKKRMEMKDEPGDHFEKIGKGGHGKMNRPEQT